MIITISGTPGSGKTVVCKYLSKKLGIKYYGMGELMRAFARNNNLDIIELSKLLERDRNLDKEFNENIKGLNKKDNFILDSRLGFLFIKKGVHVFLDADLDLRAKRIFKDGRKLENFKTIEEVKEEIVGRFSSERKRFKKLYNIDFAKKRYYNIVIDTTNLDARKISNLILNYLGRKK